MNLEELADRLEIIELYARYVHAGDTHDIATLDDLVFLDETTLDYRSAGASLSIWKDAKRDAFFNGVFPLGFHVSVNQIIEFEDAERTAATVRAKTMNPWGAEGSPNEGDPDRFYLVLGMHTDRLVRTERGWRFASRVWTQDWVTAWKDGSARIIHSVEDM